MPFRPRAKICICLSLWHLCLRLCMCTPCPNLYVYPYLYHSMYLNGYLHRRPACHSPRPPGTHAGWRERRSWTPVCVRVCVCACVRVCMCMCSNYVSHSVHGHPTSTPPRMPRRSTHSCGVSCTCTLIAGTDVIDRDLPPTYACVALCTCTLSGAQTSLIWICSRDANHLLPSPQVNSYTPSSQATSAVVRGP